MKETIVTFGKVALEAERAVLARKGSVGGQVMAFEHMVERLAGGFLKTVDRMSLREVVAGCLRDVDMGELDPVKAMPGMTTACAETLMTWWMSGLSYDAYADIPRMQAIRTLDEAVTERLPANMRKPTDIVEMACSRAQFASRVFGKVTFKGMTDLHPVWRPVVLAMIARSDCEIEWNAGPYSIPAWLSDSGYKTLSFASCDRQNPTVVGETSSDARHEVLEAIRWAMSLMARGHKGEDIAIASVSPGAYAGIVHSVAREADIRVHISCGTPALQTNAGQECAALADLLIRGLSHKRVRRLYEVSPQSPAFVDAPADWLARMPQDASLLTRERWMRLLGRNDMADVKPVLEPVIDMLVTGLDAAEEAGKNMLSEAAFKLWDRALRSGPASALDQTLKAMRVASPGTALDKVCFMSAMELVSAPRKFVRLLGMTSRQWPRRDGEDSLVPNYIVPSRVLSPMSVSEMDRRDFDSILATTEKTVVLSWPRMDGDGRELRASTIVPTEVAAGATRLERTRRTHFPISESDRLFMRSSEFYDGYEARKAREAAINWYRPNLNVHDGQIPPNHPRIESVFAQVQSATSLQRMIRDPLGYVWKYGLGFNAPEFEDEPLLVDARVFGNIVHAILKTSVEKLGRRGGFAACSLEAIKHEVFKARASVAVRMEQSQPIPPTLVWTQALDRAEEIAVRALTFDYGASEGMVSFAEIPFGGDREWLPEDLPWMEDRPVFIPQTGIRVRGSLDRLDLISSSSLSRVVDYKTGKTPAKPEEIGINGGKELQRGLYGFAVKTLLEGCEEIVSALYYPITDTYVPMDDIDAHMELVASAVRTAQDVLRAGHAFPGIAAADEFNDMMFCFPTRAASVYLPLKTALIGPEFEALREVWETK